MDNMAYLDQIAAKPKSEKSFPFKNFLIGAGIALIAIIVFVIFVNILSGVTGKEKSLLYQTHVRSNNLITVLNDYTKHVKSSELRSLGTTLSTVLTETNKDLVAILTEKYDYEDTDLAKLPINEEETAHLTSLNNSLEEARINGLLDRTYSRDFALQIALLLSRIRSYRPL